MLGEATRIAAEKTIDLSAIVSHVLNFSCRNRKRIDVTEKYHGLRAVINKFAVWKVTSSAANSIPLCWINSTHTHSRLIFFHISGFSFKDQTVQSFFYDSTIASANQHRLKDLTASLSLSYAPYWLVW